MTELFRALNEFNVLVQIPKVEEVTKFGLHLPPSEVERRKHMAVRATIVQVSGKSFNEDVWDQSQPKPVPGDQVLLAKHAGVFSEDSDELKFVKDRDVLAVLA